MSSRCRDAGDETDPSDELPFPPRPWESETVPSDNLRTDDTYRS